MIIGHPGAGRDHLVPEQQQHTDFAVGLSCLLDGIAALITRRRTGIS
jgi:hypothetical protein